MHSYTKHYYLENKLTFKNGKHKDKVFPIEHACIEAQIQI